MKMASTVVAVIALAACGGSTGQSSTPSQDPSNQTGNSQLSVSVTSPAVTSDGGTAQQAIAVNRIRASVASLKLESTAGEQAEVNAGPFLVDLPAATLGQSLQQVFDATVPAGTYRELDLDIAPSTSAAVGSLAGQNASIVVDGTFNGAPFTFVTAINIEIKKEGSFTVGSGTSNVTLALDPTVWFGTAAAPLDPNVATNRAAIEARIRASLTAFRDDDRNGHDDDDVGDDKGQHDAGEPGDDRGGQQDAGQGGDDHGQHDGGDDHGGHGSDDDGGH
ncbi:MAG TPA: hypothetical protein VGH20_16150 [Myxococcales bacterium]|jgi:hypothetical protein